MSESVPVWNTGRLLSIHGHPYGISPENFLLCLADLRDLAKLEFSLQISDLNWNKMKMCVFLLVSD